MSNITKWFSGDATSAATASANNTKPMSLEDIKKAIATLKSFDPKWKLISPSGDVYAGKPDDLIKVLFPHLSVADYMCEDYKENYI